MSSSTYTPAVYLLGGATDADVAVFPFDGTRYPGSDVHDPSIVRVGGSYLMVTTSPDSLAPVLTSADLTSWEERGPILAPQPDWLQKAVPKHRSVWAPAPLVVGRALRMYYCASQTFGSNTSFLGMAENRDFSIQNPTQGWEDRGLIVQSFAGQDNFNAIDPDAMIGPDGRHWMVYGSYWGGMFLLELDPETGLGKEGAQPIPVASNPSDPHNGLEAPVLRYHEGYYYLYVTYGLAAQGVRSTYRMVVGRSREPEGPYLGFDGKPMTEGGHTDLLKSSPPMFGPGGGNVFEGADGNWYLTYHYYDGMRHWHGDVWGRPTAQIRPIVWGADGWPMPGLPVGASVLPNEAKTVTGTWVYQRDFRDVLMLELKSDGSAVAPELTGNWSLDVNTLTLRWPSPGTDSEERAETLVLDEAHRYFVGRDHGGSLVRGIRTDASTRQL